MSEPLPYWIDATGEIVQAPPPAVGENYADLTPASPEQVKTAKLQQKYGGPGQQAIAGLEGLGRGVTLGASTLLERGLGVDPEGIRGREEANPVTSTVGELGGTAAGILAMPLSGPGLAARAAKAATPAMTGLAGKALAAGVGSAVEGAFYGAGRVVHEAALGDPNMTASSALATVGTTAGLFGAFGGVGKLFGEAAKEYTPKQLRDRVLEMVTHQEARSTLGATGATNSQIRKVIETKGQEGAEKLALDAKKYGLIRGPLDSEAAIGERAAALKAAGGKSMGEVLQSIDARLTQESAPSIGSFISRAEKDVLRPLLDNPLERSTADAVATTLRDYGEKYAGGMTVSDLHKMRQQFDGAARWDASKTDIYRGAMKDLRRLAGSEIDQSVERLGGKEAQAAWKEANRQYEVGRTFQKLTDQGVNRGMGNNLVSLSGTIGTFAGLAAHGAPGALLTGGATELIRKRGAAATSYAMGLAKKALQGDGAALADKTAEMVAASRKAGSNQVGANATSAAAPVAVLAGFERANQAVVRQIGSAASALVRGGGKTGISKAVGAPADEMRSAYARKVAQIQRLAQDPEQMHRALVAQTDDWHEHAPRTAQAMQTISARAVAFLASKIPQAPPSGPLAPEWHPSRDEMAKFTRYHDAVEDPVSVLKQAAGGTVTREGLEALNAVHPEMLETMRHTVGDYLATHGKQMTYQAKISAGMLMGQDLDGRGSQQALQMAALPFAPKQQQVANGAGKAFTATKHHQPPSDRTMTAMQRSANRG